MWNIFPQIFKYQVHDTTTNANVYKKNVPICLELLTLICKVLAWPLTNLFEGGCGHSLFLQVNSG